MNLRAIPAVLVASALAACGGGGGGTTEVKSPYSGPTETTKGTYDARHPDGTVAPLYTYVKGERTVLGQSFREYKMGYGDPVDDKGITVLVDDLGDGRYSFMGFEEKSGITVMAGQPYTIDTDVPVGEPKSVTVSGTTWTADDTTPRAGTGVVDYVKVSDDETVVTPAGTVTGVKHFNGTVTLDGEGVPEILRGFPVEASVWWHPAYGVVKSEIPMFNAGMDLRGQADCGDPLTPGTNVIQAMGTVQPGGAPFELDTSTCAGVWNADKMTHAKMLLELRFADEALAKTSAQPPVVEQFTTGWGYFPHQMVASPVSIFHPEENGKGFTFWYGYADEAAKNEPGSNGIPYIIQVRPGDAMTGAVRATARIRYHVIALP